MGSVEQAFFPISEISTYIQRWTIKARVTSKSVLRSFSKQNGNGGKVFHVNLLDAEKGEIRASFFGDAAEKYFDKMQQGKCYTLSRGNVRIANPQYNNCGHKYELVFDKLAEVADAADDDQIETMKLSITELRKVQTRALPATVDLCGIITEATSTYSFTSRDGKELVKREVTIADDSATSLTVTVWGERAKQEDSVFAGNPVICFKTVLVKDWQGGRSGSLAEGGAMMLNPKCPEAERVRRWWSEGGSSAGLTALSADRKLGAGTRRAPAKSTDIMGLRKVSDQVLDQPESYSVVCRLAYVQLQKKGEPQPLYYMACQELKEGRSLPCNRKVDSSGFCASCNRAGQSAPRFTARCRFSDYGDSAWLTTFHEAVEHVLGMTAQKAQEVESEGGREAFEMAINSRYFSEPLHLTVRAKLDTYNGETRTNITCTDSRPVKHGEHGRAMLQGIREMIAEGEKEPGF